MTTRYPIKYLVIHHSASGRQTTVEAIRNYHVATLGWSDIGYQHLIRQPSNNVKVEIYAGRPYDGDGFIDPWEWGAHAIGANHQGLAFCMIGDWTKEPPPQAMQEATASLVAAYCYKLGLTPKAVVGHREVPGATPTECPGKSFDMNKFRNLVRIRLENLQGVLENGALQAG